MPDARLQRTRDALPKDYRFGDGKWTEAQIAAKRDEEAILQRLSVAKD